MRLAIIKKEKCNPGKCLNLCMKVCPVNRKGEECIVIDGKAKISEELCIGCAICQNRCPFEAITIINLPSEIEKNLIHRYGENGFALYGLPLVRKNESLGLLGRNGIGKSTALDILSHKMKMNLGKNASDEEIKHFFKGSEMLNYFKDIGKMKMAYKPQNIIELSKHTITASDLLETLGNQRIPRKSSDFLDQKSKAFLGSGARKSEFPAQEIEKQFLCAPKTREFSSEIASRKKINEIAERLNIAEILDRKLNQLSGGELQRVAIAAASLKDADVYFFDEPLAYLDVAERINVSNFIHELKKDKSVVIVEHDLLLLDYLTDSINIFYGKPACYGVVAEIRKSKNAINTYLSGFLKEENVRFRDKPITFKFGLKKQLEGGIFLDWPEFTKKLGDFSLKVNAGNIQVKSITGMAGRNAIGKSTFMKCLAGILETNEKNLKLNLKISYKPQYVEYKGEETVAMIVKKEKINKRIISLLNIEQVLLSKMSNLSGGELQRVAIAACLAKDADIYLLDEPSAYLDVEERLQAARAIREIVSEKERAGFVIDHDLLFLSYLADSLIVFSGEPGKRGEASENYSFPEGINILLKQLNITLRKDEETGRPKINKPSSLLDKEQRASGEYFQF